MTVAELLEKLNSEGINDRGIAIRSKTGVKQMTDSFYYKGIDRRYASQTVLSYSVDEEYVVIWI